MRRRGACVRAGCSSETGAVSGCVEPLGDGDYFGMEMFDYSGMEESGEAREKHGRPWDTEDAAVQAAEVALAARMAAGGTAPK